jgi:toxin-antitoxin system PIN domain toxin
LAAIDLPDVNVWIALSAPDHEHRVRAERYWTDEAAPRLAFCTVTMLGLVRICSNAPLFSGAPLGPADAWAILQGWMGFDEIVYLSEPDECRLELGRMLAAGTVVRRAWTDAYLAAFAITAGARIISFDTDFHQFPGLDFLQLTP